MTAPLAVANPIVNENRTMSEELRQWIREVNLSNPIVGAGSPEGVVDADQYALYLDNTGAAGSIQYRKMLASIAGDTKQGWLLG